jgi:hypothetical protein
MIDERFGYRSGEAAIPESRASPLKNCPSNWINRGGSL